MVWYKQSGSYCFPDLARPYGNLALPNFSAHFLLFFPFLLCSSWGHSQNT